MTLIKVQLCPPEELENPLWWVGDAALAVVIVLAGYLGANWYLGTVQEEIDKVEASAASLKASIEQLKPELERFKTLEGDMAALNTKLNALKKITTSKIARYKPLIAVEHFQNLRPEGVWFKSLKIGVGGKDDFDLVGQAFDNLIVAEFMTAIRATDAQDKDDGDLRTQIGFTDMGLTESVAGTKSDDGGGGGGGGRGFSDMTEFPTFHLHGRVVERTAPAMERPKAPPAVSQASANDDAVKF